jgi:glycosyl transferase family 25
MKVYVLHYKKLTDRKVHIQNEFEKHKLTYEFYEKYDKEELSKDELKIFDSRLRDSEKSLLCKHINVYKDIIQKSENYALIFEDEFYREIK